MTGLAELYSYKYRTIPLISEVTNPVHINCLFLAGACNGDSEEVPLPRDVNQGIVQFRWHQQEQAWGKCNCWQIDEVIITDGIAARVMNFSDFEDRNGDLDE